MPAEWIIPLIVDNVFGYLLDQSGLGEAVRNRLRHDPVKQAFQDVLTSTLTQFEKQHPEWAASLFDADFLKKEATLILAQFLIRDGEPDPSDLATHWADSLNLRQSEQRMARIREIEPIAADFLDSLNHALKAEPALREINDSRALEVIAGGVDRISAALDAFRHRLDRDKATLGTLRDYLHWMIERNLYLDPRGTLQTQRQVQVRLDEIYVSLRAQREEIPGTVDRRLVEKEMAELQARLAAAGLPPEEIEDQREQLLTGFADRLTSGNVKDRVLELAEVVTRYEKVVILGDPGSGKTTLLRYLALKHAQALQDDLAEAGGDLGTAHFPIAVRIADYAEYGLPSGKALSDFVVDDCLMHECPQEGLADLLTTKLRQGNCLILLDGLDEIVNADDRRSVVRRIEEFVRRYDDVSNRFVVSSRLAGYRGVPLGEPFAHYTVQEMNETQIHRFLDRWCRAVEAAETPDLSPAAREVTARREIEGMMQAVKHAPGVRRLAANPLLLRILALIHRTGAQLPQRRIGLYRLAADTLARTWRTAQGVPESALVKEEYLTALLSKLAYWLHVNKPTGIATEREVYEVLGEEWAYLYDQTWRPDAPNSRIREEVGTFLRQVREHTGIFVERAPQRYGFMHLTFEEYYAARYLVARSKTRATLLRHHLHDPRWEEPLLLGLGFVGLESRLEAQELIETAILAEGEDAKALGLHPGPYEELLGWDYLFALRCLGDNIAVRPKVIQRLVERVADELLNGSGSARFRRYWQALEERLGELGGSSAMAELLPILAERISGSSYFVSSWSWEITQGFRPRPPELCDVMLTAFRQESDPKARTYIAMILGQFELDSPELRAEVFRAQDILSRPVVTPPDPALQEKRAERRTLTDIYKQLIQKKVTLLQNSDATMRADAAKQIGFEAYIHDDDPRFKPELHAARDALLSTLANDPDAVVRASAVWGLGHLGATSPEVLTVLLSTLHHDPDAAVRSNAAWGLGQPGATSPEVLIALHTAFHDDPDAAVRASAAWSLVQRGMVSHEMLTALSEGLQVSQHWYIREGAAEMLGKFDQGDESTIQALWQGLRDSDGYVRLACVQALVQIGQRFPTKAAMIERKLVQAIADPEFESVDTTEMVDDNYVTRRPAYDYAYDALWLLVASRKIGEEG
jgi:hypothetical protein